MLIKIQNIIQAKECLRCGHQKVYTLSDERVKCSHCGYRYSKKKIEDDLGILHYFSLEIPANKTARDLELSYKKVSGKYMQYRQDIARYLQKQFNKLSN